MRIELPTSRTDVALFALSVIAVALLFGWSIGLTFIGIAVLVWAWGPGPDERPGS